MLSHQQEVLVGSHLRAALGIAGTCCVPLGLLTSLGSCYGRSGWPRCLVATSLAVAALAYACPMCTPT
eukprot:3088978-Pyramimonas_sp.AAC.1